MDYHPRDSAKVQRVVFLCLKHYLQNVKTNVSNARMNIPKAMRSLKSKCFISTHPHTRFSNKILLPFLNSYKLPERPCTFPCAAFPNPCFISYFLFFFCKSQLLLPWHLSVQALPRISVHCCHWSVRLLPSLHQKMLL